MRRLLALLVVVTASCTESTPASATATGGGAGPLAAGLPPRSPRRNLAPAIQFGTPRPPDPAPAHAQYTLVGGQPTDPDGDEDPSALCGRTTLTVTGPCTAAIGGCGGVGDVFDVDLTTQSGPGTCEVVARVRDSHGAFGTDRLRFEVSP